MQTRADRVGDLLRGSVFAGDGDEDVHRALRAEDDLSSLPALPGDGIGSNVRRGVENPQRTVGLLRMAAHARGVSVPGMPAAAFVPVLGHPRVIGASADAELRVLAHDGDRIVGMAAFEPEGSVGDAIITLAPDASGGLVPFLLDELTARAARYGLSALRFDFEVDAQHGIAERVAGRRADCTVRRDHLDVRTAVPSLPCRRALPSAAPSWVSSRR